MTAITRALTLEDFLALPETEPPSEFISGEVVPKPMPSVLHGLVANLLGVLLFNYLHRTGEAIVVQGSRHAHRGEDRAYLPDVSVILRSHMKRSELDRGPVERVPDIAIEILSPEDRPGRVAEKVAFYLRAGTPLVWVVEPIERTVDVHRPDGPSAHYGADETLDARPVLREFSLDLAELFALVDEALPPAE